MVHIKVQQTGKASGEVAKIHPVSKCLGSNSSPSSQFQLLARADFGRHQVTAQASGSLIPKSLASPRSKSKQHQESSSNTHSIQIHSVSILCHVLVNKNKMNRQGPWNLSSTLSCNTITPIINDREPSGQKAGEVGITHLLSGETNFLLLYICH